MQKSIHWPAYLTKKGYDGIHALVAFSGKVKLPDDDKEYTEASINGFPEDRLTKEFDTWHLALPNLPTV